MNICSRLVSVDCNADATWIYLIEKYQNVSFVYKKMTLAFLSIKCFYLGTFILKKKLLLTFPSKLLDFPRL